ncbi:MAG: hypothetical protein J6U92_05800 [Clostridia bacterium]|nr:hypothetical protein [Clostridia bacterium]
MGGLLFGDKQVCLSLDKGSLWDNRPAPQTLEEGYHYDHLIELVKSGKEEDWNEFIRLFSKTTANNTPTKINAGKIIFDMPVCEKTEFYLDIATGEACVNNETQSLKSFISADKNQIIVDGVEIQGNHIPMDAYKKEYTVMVYYK